MTPTIEIDGRTMESVTGRAMYLIRDGFLRYGERQWVTDADRDQAHPVDGWIYLGKATDGYRLMFRPEPACPE